jgi:hypothetical protein
VSQAAVVPQVQTLSSAPAPTGAEAAADAGKEPSPTESRNPFSVFFSNPGPGVEAAAAVLPRFLSDSPAPGAISFSLNGNPQTGHFSNPAAGLGGSAANAADGSSHFGLAENAPAAANPAFAPQPAPPGLQDKMAGRKGNDPAVPLAAGTQAPAAVGSAAPIPIPTPPPLSTLVTPAMPVQPAVPATAAQPGPTGQASPPSPPSGPAPPAQVLPAPSPGPVQLAQIANRVGQSEMRIGMTTSAFGSVEVRTTVHASDVGVLIGSEKGDLRGLLASEMPGIASTLQQQNLRLNSVSYMQGFDSSNPHSGGGNPQQQAFVPRGNPQNQASTAPAAETGPEAGPAAVADANAGSGLSILV